MDNNIGPVWPKDNSIVNFTLWGWQLVIKDKRKHRLLFSERYAYRGKHLGWYYIRLNRIPDYERNPKY